MSEISSTMSNLLKIKVMDMCPYREKVLEYYNALSNKGNAYKGDSGVDLIFTADKTVNVDTVTKIGLGIQCEMVRLNSKIVSMQHDKEGNFVRVTNLYTGPDESKGYMLVPRSSISSTPLSMANSIGIIDAGYRGELIVAVRCHKHHTGCAESEYYEIDKGQKLFQIVAFNGDPIRVEVVDELSKTERDDNGFGSTNTNS